MKIAVHGTKNERIRSRFPHPYPSNTPSNDSMKPNPSNLTSSPQPFPPTPPTETSSIISSVPRNGYPSKPLSQIYRSVSMPSLDHVIPAIHLSNSAFIIGS